MALDTSSVLPPIASTMTPPGGTVVPPPSDAMPQPPAPAPVTATDPGTVVTGRQTVFGTNYDGSPDSQDQANSGFFTNPKTGTPYNSHDTSQAFASLPFSVYRAAIGNPYDDKLKQAVSNGAYHVRATVNGKTQDLPIGDLGPAAWTGNALDLSGGAAKQMGLTDNGKASYQIIGPDSKPVQFKGDLGIDPNAPIDPVKTRAGYSNDAIQRYLKFTQQFAPGLKVAMPEDVNRMDDYLQKGGHLYDMPFSDQLSYHLGKDPAFLTKPENFDIYYDQVWKPNASKSLGDQISQAASGAPGALWDIAKGAATYVGETAQRMPEAAAYAMNKLTGAQNPGLEKAIGDNMATNAQAITKGGVDAVDMIDAGVTNVSNLPRSLFSNLPGVSPQSREAVNVQNAKDSQALLARQFSRSGLINQAQQFASQSYNAIGAKDLGQATSSALPNQTVVEGGAFLTNPLNVALEGVGEIAGGALKPIFFERGINNIVAANKADALATAFKSAVTEPPRLGLLPGDDLEPVALQAKASLAPAVRQSAAVAGVADQDANRVWQALMQSPNEQGTVSNILKTAAPIAQGASDTAKAVSSIPELLSKYFFRSNPEIQAKAALGISLGAEHIIPLGGTAMALAKGASGPLENVAKLAGLAGKELSYGEVSLPYWQRMAQGRTGLTRGVMQLLDNPAVYTAAGMTKGVIPGAITGAAMGAMGTPQPNAGSAMAGAVQGTILGMMGGGFGQWQKYNSPGQTLMEAAGDFRRFKSMLNTTETQSFNKLQPEEQGKLSQYAQHFPGAEINFIHDPSAEAGWHDPYAGSSGGSKVTINTASQTPLEGVIAHELLHSAAHSGNYPDVIDSLLGNQNKGTVGQYTLTDSSGKPALDARGNYQTTPEFNALKQTYLDKISSNGKKASSLTDRDIAGEIWAEHGVDYLKSGQGFVDAKSAYNPAVASNPNAMKTAMAKLGYGFKPDGTLVKGTGLFPNLQKSNDVYGLMKSYMTEKRKYDFDYAEDRKDTVISPEDIKANPKILDRYKAVPEIARTQDGAPILNRDGTPVLNSKADVEKTAKSMAGDIIGHISNMSEAERDTHGVHVDGDSLTFKSLPDNVMQSLRDSGKYNAEQLNNLDVLRKMEPGQEARMFYQAALKGGKYGSIAGADRNFVPYGFNITKAANVTVKAADFGNLVNSYLKLKNKPFMKDAGFTGAADFMRTADQYFKNHVDNLPGETSLDSDPIKSANKRDAVNAALDLDTKHWREMNPFTKQIPNRTGAFIKTLRLDRINKLTPTDVIRPFKSDRQYDLMNRNYLPQANP